MLVIKLGGGSAIDIDRCCDDIAAHWREGARLVLLHGGSDEMTELSERLGTPARFLQHPNGMTSRYTDRETIEVMAMACAGRRNLAIVEALQKRGIRAVGLSGVDGGVLQGPRKSTMTVVEADRRVVVRDNYSGKVTSVNTHLLHLLLAGGYLPVLSPPALSFEGEAINVDGDRAAAAVAGALCAEALVLLTDVPGLLRDREDTGSVVPNVAYEGIDEAMRLAQGSMKKKIMGAREALEAGVPRVVLAPGHGAEPLRRALNGQGTVLHGPQQSLVQEAR